MTKIVATILRYAVEGNASDIHIERLADKIRVRFRVDGELHTSLILPVKVHDAVVARIKVLCNMKLDERRKPQDGRFGARIDSRKVDFRVSTFPATTERKSKCVFSTRKKASENSKKPDFPNRPGPVARGHKETLRHDPAFGSYRFRKINDPLRHVERNQR